MTLIERIEAAEGPSRELDEEIALSLGWVLQRQAWPEKENWLDPNGHVTGRAEDPNCPPRWTSSIDAALTLLPERAEWSLAKAAYGKSFACIDSGDDRVEDFKAYAQTPALALLAAIMKIDGL